MEGRGGEERGGPGGRARTRYADTEAPPSLEGVTAGYCISKAARLRRHGRGWMLGRWAILDVGRGSGTTGPPAATWSPGHLAAELGVGPDEQVCTLHTAHRTPHRSVQVQRGIGAGSDCMDGRQGGG